MTYIAILLGVVAGLTSAYFISKPLKNLGEITIFLAIIPLVIPFMLLQFLSSTAEVDLAYVAVSIVTMVVKLGLKDTSWKS